MWRRTNKLRLGIVGSREIKDSKFLFQWAAEGLKLLLGSHWFTFVDLIVSGEANGVDTLSVEFAKYYAINHRAHLPNWEPSPGKKNMGAGYERNQIIVNDIDCCVVVWDAQSSGTQDTIRRLKESRTPYIIVITGKGEPNRVSIDIHDLKGWEELHEEQIRNDYNKPAEEEPGDKETRDRISRLLWQDGRPKETGESKSTQVRRGPEKRQSRRTPVSKTKSGVRTPRRKSR